MQTNKLLLSEDPKHPTLSLKLGGSARQSWVWAGAKEKAQPLSGASGWKSSTASPRHGQGLQTAGDTRMLSPTTDHRQHREPARTGEEKRWRRRCPRRRFTFVLPLFLLLLPPPRGRAADTLPKEARRAAPFPLSCSQTQLRTA